MNTKIITKKLTSIEFIDLTKSLKNRIKAYLNALIDPSQEFIEWYQKSDWTANNINEIFDELWDEEENYLGFGIDAISMKIVLTEETRVDIKSAYMKAKDQAVAEFNEENMKK